MDVNIVVIH